MKKKMRKWFTVIELLIVVTIMWILALASFKTYNAHIISTKEKILVTEINSFIWQLELYNMDNNESIIINNDWENEVNYEMLDNLRKINWNKDIFTTLKDLNSKIWTELLYNQSTSDIWYVYCLWFKTSQLDSMATNDWWIHDDFIEVCNINETWLDIKDWVKILN